MGGLHFQETSILAEGLRDGYTSKIHSIYARGLTGRLQFQESSIFTGRYMGGLHFQESWENYTSKTILLLNNVNWGGFGEDRGGRESEDGGRDGGEGN